MPYFSARRNGASTFLAPLCLLTATLLSFVWIQPSHASEWAKEVINRDLVISSVGKVQAGPAVEAYESLRKGAVYLLAHQNDDGSWGAHPHPAIAALCVMAIHDVKNVDPKALNKSVDKAMEYVLSFAQEDGSIYPADRDKKQSANYPNYTTSIALLAMTMLNRPQDFTHMQEARTYLLGSQFSDSNTVDFGGIGYGKTGRADLSNGAWAAEALYYSEYLHREPFVPSIEEIEQVRTSWSRFRVFLSKCQNLPETNEESYVSKDKRDEGGFIYRPGESKAGQREDGGLMSSGSMTWSGLRSMLYAREPQDGKKVSAAWEYLMHNFDLKANPEMGMQGLYYYLLTMTKTLSLLGDDEFVDAEGRRHEWRTELLAELTHLQKFDGHWANTHGRYMESLPELASAYAMISMKVALGEDGLFRTPPADAEDAKTAAK